MPEDLFPALDRALESAAPDIAFDLLAKRLRDSGNYAVLFEARLMRKRLELGLPLVQTEPSSTFPESLRPAYEQAVVEAAREAGEAYLAAGNIEAGYRYLRAIGETDAVAEAIERVEPGENNDAVIAVAFQEGVHPAKGLELILRQQGMCRAITTFGMYAVEKDRERCIGLLVRALHAEVAERIGYAIEQREGARPESLSLPELMQNRDWLFGEYDYYVDTSHLTSLLPYTMEVTDPETLGLLAELCDYGSHLSANFAFPGPPPFEDGYRAFGHMASALRGDSVDEHVAYFRERAAEPDSAQALVNLLVRLKRFGEALAVFLATLRDEDPAQLRCPSALQLCHMAGDYDQLRELARERGDVLSYLAARLATAKTSSHSW